MRPLAWGLAALVLTACDPARAPAVPDGRVLAVHALDGEHALVTVAHDRGGTLALLDGTGAAVWTSPWTGAELEHATYRGYELTAEHLVLIGDDTRVYARADGRLLARHPLLPDSLMQRMAEPGSTKHRLAGGLALTQASDTRRTWITAFDPLAGRDVWQIGRPGAADIVSLVDDALVLKTAGGPPDAKPRAADLFEIVDVRTGARRGRVLGRDHCVADGTLFVFDGRQRVTVADLAQPQPRVVALRPTFHETGWTLESCHRDGARAWLGLTVRDQRQILDLDLEQARQTARHGLCDDSFEAAHGRWLVIRPPVSLQQVTVYDVVGGAPAWRQDPTIDATHYSSQFSAGGVLYLRGLIRDGSRAIWRLIALDAASGEIVGAAAIVGADGFAEADVQGGQLWLFQHQVTSRGAVPLVRLDARTLQPRGPLPRGLDVVDTTDQARAARLAVDAHQPGVTWDPESLLDPFRRCWPADPPPSPPTE